MTSITNQEDRLEYIKEVSNDVDEIHSITPIHSAFVRLVLSNRPEHDLLSLPEGGFKEIFSSSDNIR